MTERLVIFGAGALARETFEVVSRMRAAGSEVECIGFLVEEHWATEPTLLGQPIFSDRRRFDGDGSVRFCIALGEPVEKARIANLLSDAGAQFFTVLDPQVWLGSTSTIGDGSIVFGHSSITADTVIGRHVLINPGCTIAHDNRIGDFSSISPGVDLAGYVECGERSFLGTGATVRPRTRIGRCAYVGAGAVVVRDVGDDEVVIGNPARPFRRGTNRGAT